ncbi:hypothetical protein AWM75_06670 [Aerococcus urinaehominis]|uniref:Membrane insertase YidC/Oxa/ALB C-terminal domain-containing protein n=2 Tax=Aerococcus urinaehominis TaxID=128944 RepID=A0A0X8FMI5_9LACT|nr:hypothetical protein AWM75_06670 [Aerococcus urinaehominis]
MMLTSIFFLTGCVNAKDSNSLTFKLFVQPINNLIEWLADFFNGNYGWAIIAITIIVRLVLLPLTMKQLNATTKQSVKMQKIQPYLKDIQERQKRAQTQAEQMQIAQEQQALFKDNNISMLGGMGCLPLLIQLPIISGMYNAIRLNEGIANFTFFNTDLGEPSIVYGIIAVALYALQSVITIQAVPEEQKAQMKSSMMMMPIMMAFIVFTTPAGLTLYFIVGGLWAILQSLYTNKVFRPRVQAQVEAELAENPIKFNTSNQANGPIKDVTNTVSKQIDRQSKGNRNQGKQNKS